MPHSDPAERKAYLKEWRQRNRVSNRKNIDVWRANNPDKVALQISRRRELPYEVKKNARLKSSYGVSLQEIESRLDKQGGRCQLCKVKLSIQGGPETEQANVDHCHVSGRIRGLLCRKCNTALGQFHDSWEFLMRAVAYLWGDLASVEDEFP